MDSNCFLCYLALKARYRWLYLWVSLVYISSPRRCMPACGAFLSSNGADTPWAPLLSLPTPPKPRTVPHTARHTDHKAVAASRLQSGECTGDWAGSLQTCYLVLVFFKFAQIIKLKSEDKGRGVSCLKLRRRAELLAGGKAPCRSVCSPTILRGLSSTTP